MIRFNTSRPAALLAAAAVAAHSLFANGLAASPKFLDTAAGIGLQGAAAKFDATSANWATDSLGTGFGTTLLTAGDDVLLQVTTGQSYTLTGVGTPSLNSLTVDNANFVDLVNSASQAVLKFGAANTGITIRGASALTIEDVTTPTGSTFITGSPPLSVRDGSTFVINGNATANKVVTLGAISFGAGENSFRLQRSTAFNLAVTAASLTARPTGSSNNFVVDIGSNTRMLLFASAPGIGLLDQGYFYGGSSYAAYDATNGIRALNYSTDGGATVTSAVGTFTAAGANGKHVDLGTTGNITAAGNESINTLRFGGTNGVTIGAGNILTIANGGVLKTGGGSASITGGTGITAGSKEFVFRADTAADTLIVSSPIDSSSTGGVTKSGLGVVVLNSVNSYTGPTTITGGVLRVGPSGLGSGNVTLLTGVLESSIDLTNRSIGTAASQIQITGGASGFSASSAPVNIDLGGTGAGASSSVVWGAAGFVPTTLILNETTASGAITFANTLDLNGGARIIGVNSTSNAATVTGPIIGTGGGSLNKTGAGTLVLSGANTYPGGTTVSNGILQFAAAAALPGTGKITVGVGGAVSVAGAFTDVASWIGSGKLATDSAGALALTGAASAEAINLATYKTLSIGSTPGNTLTYTGTITPGASGYFVGGGGGTIILTSTNTFTGASSVTAGNGGGGAVIVNAANSFTGSTTVNTGTLQTAHANALGPGGGGLTVGATGTLDLFGSDLQVGALNGAAGGVITDTSTTPGVTTLIDNIAGSAAVSTFTGALKNGPVRTLAFVKEGAGTLVFNSASANTITTTALNNGRFELRTNNASVLPASASLSFTGTATLALANNSANAATVAYGAVTLIAGEATIESNNYGGKATGTQTVTLPAVPARPVGTVLNFTLGNTTVGTAASPSAYKVAFTAAPAAGQSIDGGVFYSGYTSATPDFAAYDATGYVRPLSYAADSSAVDVNTPSAQATLGSVTGKDVQLRGGGGISGQTSDSIRTLKIADNSNVTLQDATQFLNVSAAGILKTGGNPSIISGGSITGSTTDLSVRTAAAADILTIDSTVADAAGASSGLTKSGAGRLVLTGNNTYSGITAVLAGTLQVDGKIGGPVTLTGGTLTGSGTIQLPTSGLGSGGVYVAAVATLALTVTGGTPLTITAWGSNPALNFSPSSTLAVALSHVGTSAPSLVASGSVDLTNATFNLSNDGTVQTGDVFTLIHDPYATPFGVGSLPGGSGSDAFSNGVGYRLSTRGNDLILTVDSTTVPEPSCLALAVLGTLPLWARRRRRSAGAGKA